MWSSRMYLLRIRTPMSKMRKQAVREWSFTRWGSRRGPRRSRAACSRPVSRGRGGRCRGPRASRRGGCRCIPICSPSAALHLTPSHHLLPPVKIKWKTLMITWHLRDPSLGFSIALTINHWWPTSSGFQAYSSPWTRQLLSWRRPDLASTWWLIILDAKLIDKKKW